MPNYNFSQLSPIEFEELVRDLLCTHLGIDFESFTSGADGGIDLRHSAGEGNTIIVQAKHYAGSSFSALKSNLKNGEHPKVIALGPDRYIIATSLGLTPANKDALVEIFGAQVLATGDILSRESLNDLLGQHPEVERRNIKLWITTTVVLEEVLHSGIYNYTSAQIDSLEKKLCSFTKSVSFDAAKKILSEARYCIISGPPGIGKTTLAEMLLIDYMRDDYSPVCISQDIEEAFKAYSPNEKRLYYYDDFLGQTGLDEKLNKNEDQRIIDFCQLCAKSPNALFILTTREYILKQAEMTYEKLAASGIDAKKCILDLGSYSLLDRAKILYNHVIQSGLPEPYRQSLVSGNSYIGIVTHRSFNPRVVEWMTNVLDEESISADRYVEEFMARLDNPLQIWDHAFHSQLSEVARQLVFILFTLPPTVFLTDCRKIFVSFREKHCQKYTKSRVSGEFESALKEAEGTFLQIILSADGQVIRFLNPSVRDYLAYQLAQHSEFREELTDAVHNFDQVVSIYNSLSGLDVNPLIDDDDLNREFQKLLSETIDSNSIRLHALRWKEGLPQYFTASVEVADRLAFILRLNLERVDEALKVTVAEKMTGLISRIDKTYDWSPIASVMESLGDAEERYDIDTATTLTTVIDQLSASICQTQDAYYLANIVEAHPQFREHVTSSCDLGSQFDYFFSDELKYLNTAESIGDLEDIDSELRHIETILGVELGEFRTRVQDEISGINLDEDSSDPPENVALPSTSNETQEIDAIHTLFGHLKTEL